MGCAESLLQGAWQAVSGISVTSSAYNYSSIPDLRIDDLTLLCIKGPVGSALANLSSHSERD